MNEQLHLLRPDDRPWQLDDHTRQVGRQGLQEARAALRQAAAPTPSARPAGGARTRLLDRPARPAAA